MNARRWLPLSGLVFVVLVVVSVVAIGGDTPESTASGTEVASFYSDELWRQAIGAFVLAASIPFLVFFVVSLATAVWPGAPDRRGVWQYVLIGGGVLTGATIALAAAIHFALTDGADNDLAPVALQAVNLLDGNIWVAFNSGLGVLMLGAAGCLIPLERSRRWFGWVALGLGISLFIPFADFIGLLLSLVWIIAMSVMLFREPRVNGSAVAPAAA